MESAAGRIGISNARKVGSCVGRIATDCQAQQFAHTREAPKSICETESGRTKAGRFVTARQAREFGHRAHRLASSTTAGRRAATRSGLGCRPDSFSAALTG